MVKDRYAVIGNPFRPVPFRDPVGVGAALYPLVGVHSVSTPSTEFMTDSASGDPEPRASNDGATVF